LEDGVDVELAQRLEPVVTLLSLGDIPGTEQDLSNDLHGVFFLSRLSPTKQVVSGRLRGV
jgi:hypothetical protein